MDEITTQHSDVWRSLQYNGSALYCIIIHTESNCTVTHHMWQWTIHSMIKIVTSLSQSSVTSAVRDYQGNDHHMLCTTTQFNDRLSYCTYVKIGNSWISSANANLQKWKNDSYIIQKIHNICTWHNWTTFTFEFSKHCIGDCITSTNEIVFII